MFSGCHISIPRLSVCNNKEEVAEQMLCLVNLLWLRVWFLWHEIFAGVIFLRIGDDLCFAGTDFCC